jgi:putative ABC transport system permease protein
MFAVTATLTLALGIGATTAVFSVVDVVLLRPLPYPNGDRLITIWGVYPHWRGHHVLGTGWERIPLSWPEYLDVRAQAHTLEAIALDGDHQAIYTDTVAEELHGAIVTSTFFPLLGAYPILGRTFEAREDYPDSRVVVLSHVLWRRLFGGDRSVIGRTIRLDDQQYVVIGVLAPQFRLNASVQYWIPFGAVPDRLDRGDHSFRAIARRRHGVGMDDVRRQIEPILRAGQAPERKGAAVGRLFDKEAARATPTLLLLSTAVAVLLLIACGNVAGLLLGEAARRQQEMAVRAALGASRSRIMRHLLLESVALALIGGALGIGLAFALTSLLVSGAPADVAPLEFVTIDVRVLAFASVLMFGTVLMFGCGPALAAARRADAPHLKEGGRTVTAYSRGQSLLVIGQVALTMTLLFAAGLLVTTLFRLGDVDPGFARDNLVTMRVRPPQWRFGDAARRRLFDEEVLQRVAAVPGVRSVAWVGGLPFSGESPTNALEIEGVVPGSGQPKPEAQTRAITADYLKTMEIPIVAGREFRGTDSGNAPPVALVSQVFERRYSARGSAVGLRFRWQAQWWTVVGVVADVKHEGLDIAEQPTFYVPAAQKPGRAERLVVRTEPDRTDVATAVGTAIRSVDRDAVIEKIASMNDLIGATLVDERYRATLAGAFALFATVLAAIGLYGTVARAVVDRQREFGIRIALGGRPIDVLSLVLKQGTRLVLGGITVGLAATFLGGHAVRTMLFGVSWFDPATLLIVIAVLVLITLLAVSIPARRATRVDPIVVLRAE